MKNQLKIICFVFGISLCANAQVTVALPGGASEYNPTEALDVTSNMSIRLPDDGVLAYTSIVVRSGATLSFLKPLSGLNPPVKLLSIGPVSIEGTVSVRALGGVGGPGGFDGALATGGAISNGGGPGGGQGFVRGVYSSAQSGNDGIYGNDLIYPLIGGSGGGASATVSGGGGGGAIVIASDKSVSISGAVNADGSAPASFTNIGASGAIRIVAPNVLLSGDLSVDLFSDGRSRVDSLNPGSVNQAAMSGSKSVGSILFVEIPNPPKLTITSVAGSTIAPGTPAVVTLPDGTLSTQSVTVQQENIPSNLEVYLIVRPDSGPAVRTGAISFTNGIGSIDVEIPPNNTTHIEAYTRPAQ